MIYEKGPETLHKRARNKYRPGGQTGSWRLPDGGAETQPPPKSPGVGAQVVKRAHFTPGRGSPSGTQLRVKTPSDSSPRENLRRRV